MCQASLDPNQQNAQMSQPPTLRSHLLRKVKLDQVKPMDKQYNLKKFPKLFLKIKFIEKTT